MNNQTPSEIAASLSEAERDFVLETPGRAPASAATSRRCEDLGLYEWMAGVADWIRWTDLGLAVRTILKEQSDVE